MMWPYPLSLVLPDPAELAATALDAAQIDEVAASDSLPDVVLASVRGAPGPLESAYYQVTPGPTTCYRSGVPFRCTLTIVDGIPMEVATAAAYGRMRDAARAAGVPLRAVSGFRTMAHQRALYDAYQRGAGPIAARPGFSNHQSGVAVDLNTPEGAVLWWLRHHAARFGFRRTVRSEGWHWEYVP